MNLINLVTQLMQGLGNTLFLFVLTLVFSLPLGLLVTFGRMSGFKPIQYLMRFFISILRGTPLMLQIIVVFYGPYYALGLKLAANYRIIAVVIAFSINYAAYFAEIFRAGIESIDRGQYEAAQVLGYSRRQTFFRIIFPQMVKRVLPPVTNEVITLVKDTSLAFALAVTEMFTIAKQIAASQASITPYIAAAIFYYIFNLVVAMGMEKLEKAFSYYH